jgi:hypothetical protein
MQPRRERSLDALDRSFIARVEPAGLGEAIQHCREVCTEVTENQRTARRSLCQKSCDHFP